MLFLVANMLYAYGDDPNPLPETIRLLDEIIVEYVPEFSPNVIVTRY
jgi:transcription initiation factor IID TFIID-18 subunit